jgi:hypothetical protein
MSEIEGKGPRVGAERARQRASFNEHESFRPESLRGFGVRRSTKGQLARLCAGIRGGELDAAFWNEAGCSKVSRHLVCLADNSENELCRLIAVLRA